MLQPRVVARSEPEVLVQFHKLDSGGVVRVKPCYAVVRAAVVYDPHACVGGRVFQHAWQVGLQVMSAIPIEDDHRHICRLNRSHHRGLKNKSSGSSPEKVSRGFKRFSMDFDTCTVFSRERSWESQSSFWRSPNMSLCSNSKHSPTT